uniref:Uncharacterized protein n=1 Tax=Nitrosopumivirus cobalaminus TaxID=3158414 RepID=A0AAU7N461_9VIRU
MFDLELGSYGNIIKIPVPSDINLSTFKLTETQTALIVSDGDTINTITDTFEIDVDNAILNWTVPNTLPITIAGTYSYQLEFINGPRGTTTSILNRTRLGTINVKTRL